MKIFLFLIITIMCFLSTSVKSQTLLNALEIRSLDVELNDSTLVTYYPDGRMLIPYNTTKIKLFQNNEFAYWAEFRYRKCGKKAKLESKTFVETKDGEVFNGSRNKMKLSIEEGQPAWFIAYTRDTIEIKSDNKLTLIAGFDFDMRSSN